MERSVYRHGESPELLDAIVINPFKPQTVVLSQPPSGEPTAISASQQPTLPLDLKAWLAASEKQIIIQALQQSRHNQRQAAQLLNLTYHQLRGIMKKLDIQG